MARCLGTMPQLVTRAYVTRGLAIPGVVVPAMVRGGHAWPVVVSKENGGPVWRVGRDGRRNCDTAPDLDPAPGRVPVPDAGPPGGPSHAYAIPHP
jgi:hypothetical protein